MTDHVPQPNFRTELVGRYISTGRTKVTGICLHDTAGSGTHGDTKYLANPSDGRKVCCDFTVERDGSIWQLNPDLDKYYTPHAGRRTAWKDLTNNQVTRSLIGIEIVQHVKLNLTPTYTFEQIKATAHLCAWLVEKYGLVPADITTHRQIITDGSRSDPRQFPFEGKGGFWEFYWMFFGQNAEFIVSETIQKVPEKGKKTYNVKEGDTLFSIGIAHEVHWQHIKSVNGLKSTIILPGQVLEIPAS